MARYEVGVDAGDYKAREPGMIIPEAKYLFEIVASEEKITKAGDPAELLKLRVKETPPSLKSWRGATVEHFLNVPNPSSDETQVRIFMETWKAIQPDARGTTLDTGDWIGKAVVGQIRVVEEPWDRVDNVTGESRTIMTKKSRIKGFYMAASWRAVDEATTASSTSSTSKGSGSGGAANGTPGGGKESSGPVDDQDDIAM